MFTGALLLLPRDEAPEFGIDRPLLAEVVRFASVIAVGTLVLWRSYRRPLDQMPTMSDVSVVGGSVCALTLCALFFGSSSGALAILVVASIMMHVAGYDRWDALLPMLVWVPLFALLVLPHPHLRARFAHSVPQTIATRLHAPESTLAGSLMAGRQFDATRDQPWLDLPPRAARQLAIASIVGVAGYPAASALAVLFGVIGWLGFRRARDAATPDVRVMVAGMTATLVVPAALHMVGCLVLLRSHAGPLPFVSYGPGELVLAWTTIGFVAAAERS